MFEVVLEQDGKVIKRSRVLPDGVAQALLKEWSLALEDGQTVRMKRIVDGKGGGCCQ